MIRGVFLGSVLGAFIVLLALVGFYQKQNTQCQKELAKLQTDFLLTQEELKKRELDLVAYKEEKPKIEQKIITKYKVIKQKDESCQSFKEGVHEIINAFYSPPP